MFMREKPCLIPIYVKPGNATITKNNPLVAPKEGAFSEKGYTLKGKNNDCCKVKIYSLLEDPLFQKGEKTLTELTVPKVHHFLLTSRVNIMRRI